MGEAPELFQSQCPRFESDVYAFAKTVLEALAGEIHHKGLNDFAIMRSVVVEGGLPGRPWEIPPRSKKGNGLWNMLTRCYHLEPKQRPVINEVYQLVRYQLYPPFFMRVHHAKERLLLTVDESSDPEGTTGISLGHINTHHSVDCGVRVHSIALRGRGVWTFRFDWRAR
ncbi:hypothetical protein RSAG8_03976, partial [Rhizoctonia solani AG-8 WAC10335]